MAASMNVCGICELRHINRPSVIWCSECDEGLCLDCADHHSLSKLSRKHSTIPITEYQNLPSHILEIREYCQEHNEKLQLFCKQHDFPCCRLCVVDKHITCKGVTAIERVIQNVKTSDTFQDTTHLINEMLDTIEKLRKNRMENLSSVQQQRQIVEKELLEARTKINKHLDHVQEILINELAEVETKVTQQTDEVLTSLEEEGKQLHEYQATMSSIKQYATDLQTFLSIKGIHRGVASKEESINALVNTDGMNNTTLSCQIDKVVKQFQANIPTLGKITIQSLPCEIVISRKKNKQAQIMVNTPPSTSIENIKLKLHRKTTIKGTDIRGFVLLPDGRMLFSCYNKNRVRSINKDGSQEFDTGNQLIGTFDIAYTEDASTIAVTSGGSGSQCINIIDMRSGIVKKTIPVKSKCDGIVYRNNTLIYCARSHGLRMINLSDNSVHEIMPRKMPTYAYVATFRDRFYLTDNDTHIVTCCDLQGKTQWQFKDESILKTPFGITVDNDGSVYVVGKEFNNVVVISSDGQHRRQLLSKEDGLDCPQVLHYESSTNRLLVANKQSVALLFQVSK